MNIGEKLLNLRKKNHLTQEELANRCELTKGYISQIERNLTSPSISTLQDMLECLGTSLNNFFKNDDNEQIVFYRDDMFEQSDEEKKINITWLITNAQKNNMEPILIDLDIDGQYGDDNPHEGEEFGYVIKGKVEIKFGHRFIKAKKGDAFYYKSKELHGIYNIAKSKSSILLISTPPSF